MSQKTCPNCHHPLPNPGAERLGYVFGYTFVGVILITTLTTASTSSTRM